MVTGMVVRIWATGRMTWSLRYYPAGRERRISLGEYPVLSLAEARDKALAIKRQVTAGEDPRRSKTRITLSESVERWAADQEARKRKSWPEMVRILRLHVLGELGNMALADIARADVRRLLEQLRDRKGLTAQVNRVQAAMSGIFTWALDAGEIETHPMSRMRPLVHEQNRGVVLSLDQLAKIWQAADEVPSLAGPAVKLLLLTAARREEVGQMRWSELNFQEAIWYLPAERHKGKRGLAFPLSRAALGILNEIPRGVRGDHVFSSNGGATAFAGWKRLVVSLRKAAGLDVDWRIHDIRRGVATGLGEHLQASEELVGQVLGHSKLSRIGITAAYDKAERMGARGQLLEAWARKLVEAANGKVESNVVPMRVS
jgi:integrase